jgi:hypothetical protein
MLDEKEMDKIVGGGDGEAGEASATRWGVISGPREPVLGKKTRGTFFGYVR